MRYFKLLAVAGVEAGAIVLLHHLGSRPWTRLPWQGSFTRTEDAIAATLWLLALIGMYWLAGSSLLYALARLARLPAAVRAVRWATLPPLRRLVDGALVLGVSLAAVGLPPTAVAAPPPVALTQAEERSDVPIGIAPAAMLVLGTDEATPWAPLLPPAPSPSPGKSEALLHLVEPGDNLWMLAAARLAEDGTSPTAAAIVPYWRRVVDLNTPRLRSGNPDLIYPGETVALPQPDAG